jgi:hypothetical protein
MATGTTIKNVFASHLHKSNAKEERERSEDMVKYFRDQMLVLASMTPMNIDDGNGVRDWPSYVLREVDEMFEELGEHYIRAFLARLVEDFPEDCIDELED